MHSGKKGKFLLTTAKEDPENEDPENEDRRPKDPL